MQKKDDKEGNKPACQRERQREKKRARKKIKIDSQKNIFISQMWLMRVRENQKRCLILSGSCGLFTSRGVNKPTTGQTRHPNDFVNAKSYAREKPLHAGYTGH